MNLDVRHYCDRCGEPVPQGEGVVLPGPKVLCGDCLKKADSAQGERAFEPRVSGEAHPCPACGRAMANNAMRCRQCGYLYRGRFARAVLGYLAIVAILILVVLVIRARMENARDLREWDRQTREFNSKMLHAFDQSP